MEDEIEEYVKQIKMGETDIEQMTTKDRIAFAKDNVVDIVKRVWVYVLIGVGIGAFIHGLYDGYHSFVITRNDYSA